MRTSFLFLVPCVLLGGLLFGAFRLGSLSSAGAPCTLGMCPLSIHERDSGRMFIYPVATRFEVFLDESKNPQSSVQCLPDGVINLQRYASAGSLYSASFETLAPGTCVLAAMDFSVTIVVQ